MASESSVVEQLRLQEGRMFQDEKTLALYLDVKAVIFEALVSAARADGPEGPEVASKSAFAILEAYTGEDSEDRIVAALTRLGPRGMRDYHAKSLYDCTKSVCKLLWPSQILLVARPKVSTLIRGLLKRLLAQDAVRSGAFFTMDPIKQDFVLREAFRRCIVNDCLVVFDNDTGMSRAAAEDDSESEQDDATIGPDDSASQVMMPVQKRPVGARSALGVVPEDAEAEDSVIEQARHEKPVAASVVDRGSQSILDRSVVEQAAKAPPASVVEPRDRSVVERSVVGRASVAPSIAPKIVNVRPARSSDSQISAATGVTATSIMRKAINVRKIHLEPDHD